MKAKKKERSAAGAGVVDFNHADLVNIGWEWAINCAKNNDAALLIRMLGNEAIPVPEIARSYFIDIMGGLTKPPLQRRGRKPKHDRERILNTYKQMMRVTKKETRDKLPTEQLRIFKNADTVKVWIEDNLKVERKALDEIIYPRKRTGKKSGK